MKKLEILDSIRGFAAIYVVLNHVIFFKNPNNCIIIFGFNILSVFEYAQDAVMIFFILSGFVIQHSFMNTKDKSFSLYLFKRFTRIYIPLVAVIIATGFVQYLSNSVHDFSLKILVGNLLMLQDMPWRPGVIVTTIFGNYPLWSLSYEWWYYMLFYFITVCFKSSNKSAFIYGIAIIAIITYHFYSIALNRWLLYLIIWWIGRDMAILYNTGRKISFRNLALPLVTLIIGILITGISVKYYEGQDIGRYINIEHTNLLRIFFIISIALLWYKAKWKFFDCTIGHFNKIASISYGLYISHMFLIVDAEYFKFVENPYIRYFLYFIVCFAFSYFIEHILYLKLNSVLKKAIFRNNKSSLE